MAFRYSVSFYPDKERGNKRNARIRCRIHWQGERGGISVMTGYTVALTGWNSEEQRCKRNTVHNGVTASEINAELDRIEAMARKAFEYLADKTITKKAFQETLRAMMGQGTMLATTIESVFRQYLLERCPSWSDSTIMHYEGWYKNDIKGSDFAKTPVARMDALVVDDFVKELMKKGCHNTTLMGYVRMLSTFKNWCIDKGYCAPFRIKQPRLPGTGLGSRTIIALTANELKAIARLNLDAQEPLYNKVRNEFLFACYTGLRLSDLQRLRWADIQDGKVSITEKKTSERTEIPLIPQAKEILDGLERTPDGLVFEFIKQGNYDRIIKQLGKLAKINQPVSKAHFVGAKRIEETKPKYKWLASHAARKTFVTLCLTSGIPVPVVMSMSGHNSYNTMRSYIAVAARDKEKEIAKFAGNVSVKKPVKKAGTNRPTDKPKKSTTPDKTGRSGSK